jgi:hypothetical protein
MASFAGLISGVLGGAAAGYGEGAQMEMKKQADLDLKKQMLDAESEKTLRLDEINRNRNRDYARAETAYNQNPDTIAAAAKAQAAKFDELIKAGVPAAEARLLVAQGIAAAGVETTLAPVKAAAASATTLANAEANAAVAPAVAKAFTDQYKASKEFEKLKAGDATTAQIDKAKALAADKDYMAALEKTDLATHAGVIRVANINRESAKDVALIRKDSAGETSEDRLEAARIRSLNSSKGPGGGTPNVGLELERAEKSAKEALARALGVETKEANGAYATLKRRADGGDTAAKAKLAEVTPMKNRLEAASAEWEARKKATVAAPAPAPAAAASGPRPSLDSFRKP